MLLASPWIETSTSPAASRARVTYRAEHVAAHDEFFGDGHLVELGRVLRGSFGHPGVQLVA
jgi:hypothetical protein